jgi:hypothetical protein
MKIGIKIANLLLLVLLMGILSCAKVVDKRGFKLERDKRYAVIPFENYTDTPLAGYRIALILEGVLRSKGFDVVDSVWSFKEEEPTEGELRNALKKALQKADFVITGSVNEFRYKTGIDGEPAVSISVFILNGTTGKVVKGASLSATGWAHESLGTVAQKLLKDLIDASD